MAWAHSKNGQGKRHDLVDHLRGVAARAKDFSVPLSADIVGYYLGLWHDLGKFHPRFQEYLLASEVNPKLRGKGPDHKAAGSSVAAEHLGFCALLIQGHHGGLRNRTDFRDFLGRYRGSAVLNEALALARQAVPDLEPAAGTLQHAVPAYAKESMLAAELFYRMLFSALVDADFLDTEGHFFPDGTPQRGSGITMATLWERLEQHQATLSANGSEAVRQAREAIRASCIAAGGRARGLFRLTVPTGGGKTLSGMAFALQQALTFGQRRIIVAVPLISITQQTAEVYREVFERPGDGGPVVLEHHSAAMAEESDEFDQPAIWTRLAAENWDAPIVVTTTVQLFESLFSNKTSDCRKLHRLANSVLILDEAQALPPRLLEPILDALQQLSAHYGTTVVLSTATQPAFEAVPGFRDLQAQEIVPEPARFFHVLKRVSYEWWTDRPRGWQELAEAMEKSGQALAVVNTKRDARALLDVLNQENAFHLSTSLCGVHRRNVIAEVRRRLRDDLPVLLVATQVIEAGVDLDFPLVLRALAPLDGIIQAAGRCNREGRLERGRVIVFWPENGSYPPEYRTGVDLTRGLIRDGALDPDDAATAYRYFEALFPLKDTDADSIQKWRGELDYPEVRKLFRMIRDETQSLVITDYGTPEERSDVRDVLGGITQRQGNLRLLMRRLQPYTVSLYRDQAVRLRDLIHPVREDLPQVGEWLGRYDAVLGLLPEDREIDRYVV